MQSHSLSAQGSSNNIDGFHLDLNLNEIRDISHFLTDPDLLVWNGMKIPKRKKAFVRYVKQLNEKLEERFYTTETSLADFYFNLEILNWIRMSFEDKIKRNNSPVVSLSDKWKMWRHTRRSRNFEFTDKTFQKSNTDNFISELFTMHYADSVRPEERFSVLAKRKKIKHDDTLVVVFDKAGIDGSAAKADVFATDLDNGWVIKWGDEIHSDILGSRIFAALGYDVDHPYYHGKNEVTVIFNECSQLKNKEELVKAIFSRYKIDISPYISEFGIVTQQMIREDKSLKKFKSKNYVRFIKCSLEARPDRVKRIGSFMPDEMEHTAVLRESLLAHFFIGNWDTREQNTLLTLVHEGKYKYHVSPVFSDLGTSFGVDINNLQADFKTGLVNSFQWEVAIRKRNKIQLIGSLNYIMEAFQVADYEDLFNMAIKISELDEKALKTMIKKAHWPEPIAELYFHKLASRRKSILDAFGITDPHPIVFDRYFNYKKDGIDIIKNGKLIVDYDRLNNPESFLQKKGRFRNYGN